MSLPEVIVGARVLSGPARLEVADASLRVGERGGAFFVEANRERAFIEVEGAGRFAVQDGASVEADVDDPIGARGCLYGTVTAIVLAQQGRFALHASVVDIDGRGIALTGDRGAGKSTTALCLSQRGHRLVSDDVAPLDVEGDRVVHHATGRPVHLWPDAAAQLGIDVTGAALAASGYEKLTLPIARSGPSRLSTVVALQTDPAGAGDGARFLKGPEAAALLFGNCYRFRLLRDTWGSELMRWAAAVAQRVDVVALHRPRGEWTADAVAIAVERLAAEHADT